MSYVFPPRPNEEFLKKRAHETLRAMRKSDPAASYGDALEHTARAYGFRNWNRLVRFVRAVSAARGELEAAVVTGRHGRVSRKLSRIWTPVFFFVGDAGPSAIRRLLDLGLDPSVSDRRDDALLHWAIRWQPPESLSGAVEALLDAGARGDHVNRDGLTPADELFRRMQRPRPAGCKVDWSGLHASLSSTLPMDGDDDWLSNSD